MKILHWEYQEELFPRATPGSPTYEIIFLRDSLSGRIDGICFRWSYQVFFEEQSAFVCKAEDIYRLKKGIADYFLMKYLIENSFYTFKVTLQEKLNIIGMQVVKPDFSQERNTLSKAAMQYNNESV